MLETSFALSIVRERIVKKPPLSSPLGGGGDVQQGGGHKREKSVCMSTVSCAFFISVTVSQCRRGGEREGVYSKVYSWSRGFKGGLQSTVEKSTVVSGIPFTVDCRAVDCRL